MFAQCAQGACVSGLAWYGDDMEGDQRSLDWHVGGMVSEVGAVWTIRDSVPKLCDSRRGVPSV